MITEPTLDNIVLIGKFSDGKCRQILMDKNTEDVVLIALTTFNGEIRVLDKVIEGIDIDRPQAKKPKKPCVHPYASVTGEDHGNPYCLQRKTKLYTP